MTGVRYPTLDTSGHVYADFLPVEARDVTWYFGGALAARTGLSRIVVPNLGRPAKLLRVTAALATYSVADTGLAVSAAVNVNGARVATVALSRSAAQVDVDIDPDLPLYAGDYLSADVLSVATAGGSYTVPADLTVSAWWAWA